MSQEPTSSEWLQDPLKQTPACELDRDNRAMTRDAREIEREGMLSDMETLRAEKRELRAEVERWKYQEGLAIERCKELEAEVERLRAALQDMIEISTRNSEATLMLIAIRKCAEHALELKP